MSKTKEKIKNGTCPVYKKCGFEAEEGQQAFRKILQMQQDYRYGAPLQLPQQGSGGVCL